MDMKIGAGSAGGEEYFRKNPISSLCPPAMLQMQHEIDISERRNMRARAALTARAPARYEAKHSWPAMLATHGYENRRRFGGREEYFRKNPFGALLTSNVTKCNTRSTYRNDVTCVLGRP
jgi:hypothetical protein